MEHVAAMALDQYRNASVSPRKTLATKAGSVVSIHVLRLAFAQAVSSDLRENDAAETGAEVAGATAVLSCCPGERSFRRLVSAAVIKVAAAFSKRSQVAEIVPEPFAGVLVQRVVLHYVVDIFNSLVQAIFIELTPVISILKFGKVSDGIVEPDSFVVRIPTFSASCKLL